MAKKTWAETWGSKPVDYYRPVEALEKELRKLRTLTARRIASLKKNKAFSYATYQYEQNMKQNFLVRKPVSEMGYRQIERELRIIHDFWAAKTSTLKGAREEQLEQSARIFGGKTDKNGRIIPTRILSYEESKKFWAAKEEFYRLNPDATARFDSHRVQTIIGEAMEQVMTGPELDIIHLLKTVRQQLDAEEEVGFQFQHFDPEKKSQNFVPGTIINMEVLYSDGDDFDD